MTVENSIKLLKAYKEKMEDETQSSAVREQSKKNYENMKAHILSGKKYQGHPIIDELKESEEKQTKSKGKK